MAKEKVYNIPLSDIVNKFDVRTSLDEDRVIQFAEMYEAGGNLPPVQLLKLDNTDPIKYAYVDGRHRGAARGYLNLKDVPAVLVDSTLNDNPLTLYTMALQANYGGSKPPSRQDIVHTIARMLEAGCSRPDILAGLDFLPKGAARAHMASALGQLNKRRTTIALDAIADGLDVEAAAKFAKIKSDTLKLVIQGKKGRWGKNRSQEVEQTTLLKAHISSTLRSANTSISKKIEDFLRAVSDGDVSPKAAQDVVEAWAEHLRKTSLRVKDWLARVEALKSEVKKSNS